ncbi:GNAT family N-acetyltransferase [Rhizobium sp. ICMP 5592]|uniref:GNAT family N-acetyltransferase n=1 Tax=Rhizobium sp. ICMP 5592 TaxID=2292445 RepID=UPI0012969303|nr:GNAT family N-acetyltransferase [Rhizobium sp. ICMP 5592]MQB40694.1 N-acetyltransferase [Rhizobium sp. ICMP 5592]
MAHTPPASLVTSRLILRAAHREHAASLFKEYTGRNDTARYLQRAAHSSQAQTEAVIDAWGENNWAAGNRFVWSILHRADEKAIGLFLMFIDGNDAEIHYGLGPAFWGQGLATEAGIAVMDWVTQRSSLSEVSTRCAAEHAASLRVLEKIGLHRMLLLPDELLLTSTGIRTDAWLYSWKRP